MQSKPTAVPARTLQPGDRTPYGTVQRVKSWKHEGQRWVLVYATHPDNPLVVKTHAGQTMVRVLRDG